MVLAGFVKRMATRYVITTERLHIRRGHALQETQETRVQRVQNVNTEQSLVQRILRVGTVDFDTAGTDDSEFRFVGVASPAEVVARRRPGAAQAAGGRDERRRAARRDARPRSTSRSARPAGGGSRPGRAGARPRARDAGSPARWAAAISRSRRIFSSCSARSERLRVGVEVAGEG